MSIKNQTAISEEHLARAKAKDIPVSTKHSIEICRYLRYKTTNLAKNILEETIALKKPIPFKRFKKDMGHKPGMAAGRFPKKAANEILKLVKAAETNAQFKGLNTSSLKIIKILANKASVPVTGGRRNTSTKRTNLEIEVKEKREKKKVTRPKLSSGSEEGLEKSKASQKTKIKTEEIKKETKEKEVKTKEKNVETKLSSKSEKELKKSETSQKEIKKPVEQIKEKQETKAGEQAK
jgi:large subunit ribosomal protein L22